MINDIKLPPQQLPFNRKNKAWRKKHLDWADKRSFFNYSPVRKSVIHKKINYDLVAGILRIKDVIKILNPYDISTSYIPKDIQHYPIMNSKLNVLRGEESKRVFDYRVVITNPTTISDIELNKRDQIYERLQQWLQTNYNDENQDKKELQDIKKYFTYEWKDFREIRANCLLNHYHSEYNMSKIFNDGFMDAMTCGEEIYQCDIVGGEPTLERLNPLKVRIFKSGYSNKVEDADMIVLEDYWSPGKIIDTYYDVLSNKDLKYLESLPSYIDRSSDSMNNYDEMQGFINANMIGEEFTKEDNFFWNPEETIGGVSSYLLPYDMHGNIRVLRVYWKSRRKIKKVKSYDPETGEEMFNFYPENYILKEDEGEEEEIYYVNEAWEGTKIGEDIYVNMRPRPIQYNRLSNPSRCHFGIIGSIYNLNDDKPFSMVDMMKTYNYLYDIIHDRLNKLIAKNWGNLLRFDLSKKPRGWDVDKWIYYAKTMGLVVEDSFNEGNIGASTGMIAGSFSNGNTGIIAASDGNQIQSYINILEFTKQEMSECVGITKQREGQVSNRETVGGIERSNMQSSYITEYLFNTHDDLRKRVLEAFLETAKVAFKGRSKKFQYITPLHSTMLMEIDGDNFAESDYGICIDTDNKAYEKQQQIEELAHAALQNQKISFSAIMKLFSTNSLSEKQRIIESSENELIEMENQRAQQEAQAKQEEQQLRLEIEEAKMRQEDALNKRDNDTKIKVAEINSQAEADRLALMNRDYENRTDKEKIKEQKREFDLELSHKEDKLALEKEKLMKELEIKKQQLKHKSK